MADELDWQIETWAGKGPGWSGPWRRIYMPAAVERRSKLIALHDMHPLLQGVVRRGHQSTG